MARAPGQPESIVLCVRRAKWRQRFLCSSQPTPADKQIKTDPDRTNLRNADVSGNARANDLDIDPGEQFISFRRSNPVELKNTKTKIPIKSLGTLLIGEKGRLIVLGGYGESNSKEN